MVGHQQKERGRQGDTRMERGAGFRRPGGGGGRGGRLCVSALAGGRAAVRVLGSASLRVGAVGRRRASSGVGSISVGGAVAVAGGARVRDAAVGEAWRPCVASRSRALLAAAAARPTTGHFQRIFGKMFGVRHVRQQDVPRVFP